MKIFDFQDTRKTKFSGVQEIQGIFQHAENEAIFVHDRAAKPRTRFAVGIMMKKYNKINIIFAEGRIKIRIQFKEN